MKKLHHNILLWLIASMVMWGAAGCSTTKRLAEGEVLYTGVNKMSITAVDSVKLDGDVKSQVKSALSVPPNNALFSSNSLTFLPIELWAWNYLYTPNTKSPKHWFYNLFARDPVLIQTVRPEVRTGMAEDILFNNGYFNSTAKYALHYDEKDPKKAAVSYEVVAGKPYVLGNISYPADSLPVAEMIRRHRDASLLYEGQRYCADTLQAERARITALLRDSGYYYFRADYLVYQADTTRRHGIVDLRMIISPTAPRDALRQYRTGNITVDMYPPEGRGEPDTLRWRRMTVYGYKGQKLRRGTLLGNIKLRKGSLYSLNDENLTQQSLSQVGIFRTIVMNVTPLDSLAGRDSIDVNIDLRYSLPIEFMVEANVSSKSNSYLGPGIILGVTHNNLFGGGEQLSVQLNGSYEWQTGGGGSLLNSYEFGIMGGLKFPRLLAPNIKRRLRRMKASTNIQLGANIMNRPQYFRMVSMNTSLAYEFHTSSTALHNFTPFKLVYTKLLNSTDEFNRTLDENPAIALSFRDQFIPSIGYTFKYDNGYESVGSNRLIWEVGATEAGNILYGIYSLCGVKGEKKIMGNPFSQFVKLTNELKFFHYFDNNVTFASRFMVGAGYAYGNAQEMPYSEQFYIGGANSIRAFTIRSIGPGSYRAAADDEHGFLDQTGNFKLEANVELRFPIFSGLEGAAFVDAGNVWLLKKDEMRPGGELSLRDFGREIALGTGVGIRYNIAGYLVVRLDVGVPLHAPYDTGRAGYYNIDGSFWKNLRLHLAIGYPF